MLGQTEITMANIGNTEKLCESYPVAKMSCSTPMRRSNGQVRWKPQEESSESSFQENVRF